MCVAKMTVPLGGDQPLLACATCEIVSSERDTLPTPGKQEASHANNVMLSEIV